VRRVLSKKFKNGEENMALRKILLAILQSLSWTYRILGIMIPRCMTKMRVRASP
jgi:hypothetical protein